MQINVSVAEQLLKRTTSRCPVCHAQCSAEVWRVNGKPARVLLKRYCATHGEFSACIASDARFYWLAKGNPQNSGACCGAESPNHSSTFAAADCSCAAAEDPSAASGPDTERGDKAPFDT